MRLYTLLLLSLLSISFAETPHLSADTARVDSVELLKMQEELKEALEKQKSYLYEHPDSIDTLFSIDTLSRYRLHRQDYVNWNDLLSSNPNFTSVYYTPNSHLNRSLALGYTFPLRETRLLNGIQGTNIPYTPFEPLHIKGLYVASDGTMSVEEQTRKLISPELYICSETGLFGGNSLELRLLRNLTRHLSIGVFTSYRELKRANFNHNNGSMYQMFKSWGIDEKDLSNEGYNPEAVSHLSKISLLWNNKSSIGFDFTYGDLRNDHVYDFTAFKSIKKTDTVWFQESDFLTKLKGTFEDTLGDKAVLYVEGQFSSNNNRREPLSTTIYSSAQKNSGSTGYQGFATALTLKANKNHTLSLETALNRNDTKRYNHKRSKVYQGDLTFRDKIISTDALRELHLSMGPTLIHTKELKNRFLPRYSVQGNWEIGRSITLKGYFKGDITPTFIAYDTTNVVRPLQDTTVYISPFELPSFYGDSYIQSGISVTYTTEKLKLYGSYNFLNGIDSTTVAQYWSQGLTPYKNAIHSTTISPSLFFNNVVNITGKLTFSDTKPHIKNSNRISFHINRYKATRHFYIDLFNTFWSEREPVTFGGVTGWNKPVNDIGIKLTAEIKSFRLFYKMENLINRNNSYVPGYEMPGFIIRWGFNWTITG